MLFDLLNINVCKCIIYYIAKYKKIVNFLSIATLEKASSMGAKIANDFPEYREGIINYLVQKRIPHWELEVREMINC